ncbi:MAG TPA: 16S rRNA (cytidine(1402)-2'-O)-methyltransferase [candidate division Zixibacteria bacterium]|nr:16S rRNA (cytidine(1402)-2'-O)-methyltransferase [candidate division Zixibacteria bacterium]
MSNLYLVGTPIGNLEDISLRALRTLREVSLIAAEDTRVTQRLLERYEIQTKLVSFHEYSTPERVEDLLQALENDDIALVTDAGMPGLSDPGFRLIRACIRAGIKVVPIPGPSAAVTALVISGLPTENFLFLGFLSRQKEARRKALTKIAKLPFTLVIYEAPHRVISLLEDVWEILGNRQVVIGRELTKLYEETWRGLVVEAIEHFTDGETRGEFTLVVAGAANVPWDETAVIEALEKERERGVSRKDAAETVAGLSGWRKRDLYNLSLTIDKD